MSRGQVETYDLDPDTRKYQGHAYIKQYALNVQNLLAKGLFVYGGPEMNFEAPQLGRTIKNLLFTLPGSSRLSVGVVLAEKFDEYFPKLVSAASAVVCQSTHFYSHSNENAQLKNVVDERATGRQRTHDFTRNEYRRYYRACYRQIRKLKNDPKLKANWQQTSETWAAWCSEAFNSREMMDSEDEGDDDLICPLNI